MEQYYELATRTNHATMAEGRVISTDPRVKSWYEPVPDNYERDYDAEGYPLLIPFILDEDGNKYSHYTRVGLENVPDFEKIKVAEAEALYTSTHVDVCEGLEWCDLQEKFIVQGSSRALSGLTLEKLYEYAEALRNHTTSNGEIVGEYPDIDNYLISEGVVQ